jgi:hypothetical protein
MKRSLNVSDRKKLARGSCSNAVGRSRGIDRIVLDCDGNIASLDAGDGFSWVLPPKDPESAFSFSFKSFFCCMYSSTRIFRARA